MTVYNDICAGVLGNGLTPTLGSWFLEFGSVQCRIGLANLQGELCIFRVRCPIRSLASVFTDNQESVHPALCLWRRHQTQGA